MAMLSSAAAVVRSFHRMRQPSDSVTFHQCGLRQRNVNGFPLPLRQILAPQIFCQASDKERVESSRKFQLEASQLLAELLKAKDVKSVAKEHIMSLSEDFFVVASTYLDLAKKEGNLEVVNKLETTLQTALSVKEATLRPEIRLLNKLLREKEEDARSNTMDLNVQYLASDGYFLQLLGRMIGDVEKQVNNPGRVQLLSQLRMINKETKEFIRAVKKRNGFGTMKS